MKTETTEQIIDLLHMLNDQQYEAILCLIEHYEAQLELQQMKENKTNDIQICL